MSNYKLIYYLTPKYLMNLKSAYAKIGPEQFFMITILFVNIGNYLYNLLLGRILGPSQFADAAILITLLLVLSFIGMTFQVVTAKYAVLFDESLLQQFLRFILKNALIIGLFFGILTILLHNQLQQIFHTKTSTMFIVFGLGLPMYFVMSINRGLYQGKNNLKDLSKTYCFEMLCRLILTIAIILIIPTIESSLVIAFGILISFVTTGILFGILH